MTITENELFAAIVRDPGDLALRDVYTDWLEQAGDRRAAFLRKHLQVASLPADYPDRIAHEAELSRLRIGIDPGWLNVFEPERARHYEPDPWRVCECFEGYRMSIGPLALHHESQDTECDAWKRLVDRVEQAADDQRTSFAPLRELEDSHLIVTLPPTIAKLVAVTELVLYGSNLVRIPPEIGKMTSLRTFVPYTSYRLHWFPYEITRCTKLVNSTISTRALYGNRKHRPSFPALTAADYPAVTRACSVCDQTFHDVGRHRVWISLRVATDVIPLLVNACSTTCLDRLPAPPEDYISHCHTGGNIAQPKRHG